MAIEGAGVAFLHQHLHLISRRAQARARRECASSTTWQQLVSVGARIRGRVFRVLNVTSLRVYAHKPKLCGLGNKQ